MRSPFDFDPEVVRTQQHHGLDARFGDGQPVMYFGFDNYSNGGANDTAQVYDSSGHDTVVVDPTQTAITYASGAGHTASGPGEGERRRMAGGVRFFPPTPLLTIHHGSHRRPAL